jgi:flagellar basal-body rod modification protein FlgD
MALLDEVTRLGTGAATATAAKRKTANTLDITDFLRLMTTQLKNQDPLKPLDSTEFVAQLAQFGTVSGIQGMADTLGTLSAALRSSQALSGASLVGHQVLAQGTSATFSGAAAVEGQVEVPSGASLATVSITDSAGQVVRHISLSTAAGTQNFSWDGRADNGARLAPGRYSFEVIAGVGGSNESLPLLLSGRVTSVSLSADGTSLTVNTPELGAVALGNVRQII